MLPPLWDFPLKERTKMLDLKVVKLRQITALVLSIELVAADGGELPRFNAGAHIDLVLGNGEERSYSILNDPAEQRRYLIAVLREKTGNGGSAWIHDMLRVGDVLQSTAPKNDFPLYESAETSLLIAGGIGITPMMSMASRLKALGRDYVLYYCARSRAEAAFMEQLEEEHGSRLKPHLDSGDPAKGLNLQALLSHRSAGANVYVCGPLGLIRATIQATTRWPQGTVHYELFKGSQAELAITSSDHAFSVVLARSAKTYMIPANQSILSVLKANGHKIKSLCTTGTCGTCKVTYLSGAVEHRDDVLDDDEKRHVLQACVSRAMPGETLVLDL